MGEECDWRASLVSIRLNFIVEGQTEEAFVKNTLGPQLANRFVHTQVRIVETGRKGGYIYRGGIASYSQARRDIYLWMNEYTDADTRFTTMFDLYALPTDFPAFDDAEQASSPYERVEILERALAADIADRRFIPYIQLHEFESLLLADPSKLAMEFYGYDKQVQRLVSMASEFDSPELIDRGQNTAPSKRIINEIPEYHSWKPSSGSLTAGRIGLPVLRLKCPHFGNWLDRLESLV